MKKEKTIHSEDYRRMIQSLVRERKRLGLSQIEVARTVGITQSDLSKIENLERRLDVLEFKKLLLTYRVESNVLLSDYIANYLNLSQ